MTIFDPTNLTTDDLNSRLSPGVFAWRLPHGWKIGRRPRSRLPIDDFLTTLIARPRKPKLRSKDDLLQYRLGECPYALARHGVAYAAFFANHSSLKDQHVRHPATRELAALKEEVPDLRMKLESVVKRVGFLAAAQEYDPEGAFEQISSTQDALLRALVEAENLEAVCAKLHRKRSQNHGNAWRINFVTAMFASWWRLTGCDPSTSGLFIDFLNAGWQSLSHGAPDVSWESAIKTARSRSENDFGWRVEPDNDRRSEGRRRSSAAVTAAALDEFAHARNGALRVDRALTVEPNKSATMDQARTVNREAVRRGRQVIN